MNLNLSRIVRVAQRIVRGGNVDFHKGMIHVREEGAFIGGSFRARYAPPGGDFGAPVVTANRMPRQGLIKLVNLLGGHAPSAPLYIAPYSNDIEPQDDWTGANFTQNAGEFDDYTQTTRLPWVTEAATTAAQLSNTAALNQATLTFAAGGPYTIRGAALLEAQAKNATTGPLIAASPFDAALTGMMGGGRLSLEYVIVALDESDAA